MHDIGKIGIRYEKLNKPGKLTPEEVAMFRTHPAKGKRILEPIPSMAELIPGAWCHHENWDGCGYPRGLIGDNIPLLGRIVAIADTYDAMTSRPRLPQGAAARGRGRRARALRRRPVRSRAGAGVPRQDRGAPQGADRRRQRNPALADSPAVRSLRSPSSQPSHAASAGARVRRVRTDASEDVSATELACEASVLDEHARLAHLAAHRQRARRHLRHEDVVGDVPGRRRRRRRRVDGQAVADDVAAPASICVEVRRASPSVVELRAHRRARAEELVSSEAPTIALASPALKPRRPCRAPPVAAAGRALAGRSLTAGSLTADSLPPAEPAPHRCRSPRAAPRTSTCAHQSSSFVPVGAASIARCTSTFGLDAPKPLRELAADHTPKMC